MLCMSDWTAGYVTEIDYTYGYYAELSPVRARYAFLMAGLAFPEVENACELAFGQGVTLNIHAAAQSAHCFGNDFNPAQAMFAREMAQAAGSGAEITDESFEQVCQRTDLPDFDFIALHGIFSWVTPENQAHIEEFIRRKLKVGGVLYMSYNTYPGWSAMMPMQHLLSQHAQIMGADGVGVLQRLDASLQFATDLLAAKPSMAAANPQLQPRFDRMKTLDKHYLAHEYFNRNWEPMFFSQMAARLSSAKLSFACTAAMSDLVDALNLTPDQQALMRKIPDPLFRETVRDFMVNQQFRRDYWVRGARRLTPFEKQNLLLRQSFLLTQARADITLTMNGILGEATLQEKIHGPLLDQLADHQPKSMATLHAALKQTLTLGQLAEALLVLCAKGVLQPIQDAQQAAKAKPKTQKLNSYLMRRACSRAEVGALVSPLTGGGVQVGRFAQLFLLGHEQNKRTAADLAKFVWDILGPQGQQIIKDGKVLDTAEANIAELTQQAQNFLSKTMPILKALQIV